jgi:hypothetical protein
MKTQQSRIYFVNTTIVLILLYIFTGQSFAQNAYQTNEKSGIDQWERFIGNWKGVGWRLTEDGQKTEWHHAYNIQLKLDGRLLMLENTTTVNGEVHHKSLILAKYDEKAENFLLRVYSTLTPEGDYSGVFENGAFIYFMSKNLRFSMQVNENGEIYEKGEMKMDEQWIQVFEMISIKQN